ncbi:septal ring lytic transglycosylase RlpA family protein [Paraburkholderia guartelaensis]|uniref:Endolytic peptidoglycan transglycosylase RlpA n=1 Tax=Paraburkholderia guartelaensis TaxID=2546446 RepID=A0A4R5L3V7_9BURK|nr:septal ring lytic transglycosylase RlpA family protein [Paraburkholderia guartelaensis]TDG02198.1 septal ring lytic transglycosylase RlpA family protein [Paraburkholderia guartelaensis]
MNLRLTRRRLGSLAAVSILAGCAVPPAQQDQASSDALRTKDAAFIAPQGYGSALAALPASGTAKDNSLANAEAIDENSPDVHSFHQTGRASWYGRAFHGRRTASGERFNMKALTAAHRTLPLGSYVRVSVPGTSKWVVVKINDRGPYARGRVLDLSYAAAKLLGVQHAGTAKVDIEGLTRQEAKAAQADMLAANSNIDH